MPHVPTGPLTQGTVEGQSIIAEFWEEGNLENPPQYIKGCLCVVCTSAGISKAHYRKVIHTACWETLPLKVVLDL